MSSDELAGANAAHSEAPWLKAPATAIFLVACLLYAATLNNELVLDDAAIIPHHAALESPWDLPGIFTGRYWGDLREQDTLYRPLVIWTLALGAGFNRMVGLPFDQPAVYHLINLLLHAGVSVLLYQLALALQLGRTAALVAGLLFAVHPIHSEAVAAIVNRSELLAAGFGLAFLILHHADRRHGLALACLLLALFSKESALAWVPLAAWMDFLLGRRFGSRYVGYALVCVAWLGIRALAIADTPQDVPYMDNPLAALSASERVLTAARVQLDYLLLQIFPLELSSDYSWNQIPVVGSPAHPRVVAFALVAAALAATAWKFRRSAPVVPFAIGGYAILFAVTSNVLFPIGTVMGERLAYAPSIFFCLLAGMACRRFPRPALVVVLVVVLLFAARTLYRIRDWSTAERFYAAQVRSAPNSAKAHYGLARSVYYEAGDLDQAVKHYLRAIEILPVYEDAWNNLGAAYKDTGDLDSAVEAYQRAISLYGDHSEAHANLALIHQQRGDLELARDAYENARRIDPEEPQTLNNLAVVYIELAQPEKARPLLVEALRLDPDYALARDNLARLRP